MFVTPCHDRRTGVITVSRLAEFRAAEKALQEQMAQLEALKKDAGLKREIEFEQKLVGLMKSYDKSLRDIIAILDPKAWPGLRQAAKQQRRPRVVKVYRTPHRRADRDQRRQPPRLKAWKEQYGAPPESWVR
jgi:hypothetical protein